MTTSPTRAAIVRAHDRATEAARNASAERLALGRVLTQAQENGRSVRDLAALLDVQPTTVQRLITSAKDDTTPMVAHAILTTDDAQRAADALDLLASIDEGEHTDRDDLLRLAATLRRSTE